MHWCSTQFGHDDPASAESLGQKNRSDFGLKGVSLFVPFEYNCFPRATQLISTSVFKRYAPRKNSADNCRWSLHQSWHGHCCIPVESQKNLCGAFLRTKPREQRSFKKWSLNVGSLET
jgi:hypothetical protein